MEEKTKESPGPVCRNLNIFSSTLKDSLSNIDDLQSLHRPLVVASNELVLELLSIKNYCTLSFSDMLKWVGAISGCTGYAGSLQEATEGDSEIPNGQASREGGYFK